MMLRGKVWLLRKINRKIDKDYIMIIVRHVCSFPAQRLESLCNLYLFTLFDQSLQ